MQGKEKKLLDIAKAIGKLRADQNLSQDDLAKKLFVSRDLIAKWETGARRPDWQTIERIAAVFGVSPSFIADKSELVMKELSKCLPKDCPMSVAELIPVLNSFLERLTETEANIFLQRYYFLKNIADIAVIYHLGSSHVRTILSRTRKKLKKYIREVEK